MDKNAIKKYAIWARRELIEKVSQKALQFGIEADKELDAFLDNVNGILLTDVEKKQRKALINKIKTEGYNQVMEEVAYTWFNRFIALRFMEVNGYLPSHVRVFTDDNNNFKPQIITEALHLEFSNLDKERIMEMKQENQDDNLYKYLLISQCNELSTILPGMFQKIADYTELLLPDYLLRTGSVIDVMISDIPQSDWEDQVQIIGWLYQYYNTEPKDEVFAALKNNIKITKEKIPAVTQLFTPDWVVRYMVENSLGTLWLESHTDDELAKEWKYYITNNAQSEDAKNAISQLAGTNRIDTPEKIKCIDPCMGSGHILVYMFDVLIQIYKSFGYSEKEAVSLIISNNIWGLDIDDRAAQLSYFAVMMKARQYDRRFFSHIVQPHVYAVKDSKGIDSNALDYFIGSNAELKKELDILIDEMFDACEYGSLLRLQEVNYSLIRTRIEELSSDSNIFAFMAIEAITPIIDIAEALSQKYDVVCTNPPYMEISGGSKVLIDYVNKNYIGGKTDMFAAFIERAAYFAKPAGFVGMITQPSLTSLVSYERLRRKLFNEKTIYSLLHMGRGIFGIDFGSVSFVYRNSHIGDYVGDYFKLYERTFQYLQPEHIRDLFILAKNDRAFKYCFDDYDTSLETINGSDNGNTIAYKANQDKFLLVPGIPFAYTMSEAMIDAYSLGVRGDMFVTREGMATAGNDDFLRLWSEVDINNIMFGCEDSEEAKKSGRRWFPYNKGGDYRKWYGNNDYVVDWENDGYRIRNNKDPKTGRIRSHNYNGEYAFRKGLTWSSISAGDISIRWSDNGFLFDSKGAKGFCLDEEKSLAILGFLNSSTAMSYLKVISPTMDFKVGDIVQLPLNKDLFENAELVDLVRNNIALLKAEWDSYETSWEFKRSPLVEYEDLEKGVKAYIAFKEKKKTELKRNEERINEIVAEIYGLTGEVSFEVADDKLSIQSITEEKAIKDFISYSVGCMFGRYSIETEGIVFAGGSWVPKKSAKFEADEDNIIPIADDEYFSDDIVARFIAFIAVLYGERSIDNNISYIAKVLGGKGTPREVIRNYFLDKFYSDHCNMYSITGSGKRPIYWMFDSGKKNGFKCLVYIHRYKEDLLARIRTEYVHELQSRYFTAIEEIKQRLADASGNDKVKLDKKLKKIKEQDDEIHIFEEKIHHLADQMILVDLNDGLKTNYAKFQDVLAKIK